MLCCGRRQRSSMGNCSKLVKIGLAFPRDLFHLEAMLENCAGDIYLAGVQGKLQKSRRGAPITFLRTSFTSYPDPCGTVPPVSTSTVPIGT